MNRRQRALICAAGIIPVTVSNGMLLLCGRAAAGWILEILTGAVCFVWILRAWQVPNTNPRCYCPDCGADLGWFYSNRIRMEGKK